MKCNEKIYAGIVLYNPDIIRLEENICNICMQVNKLILIDNSSKNIDEINKLLTKFTDIVLVKNKENKGIAYALNQIGKISNDENADWFLTIDQDSICDKKLISEYVKFVNVKGVGQITCNIVDRSFGNEGKYIETKYEEIEYCITSGTLVNVEAYNICGGFDERLFIDKVDWDFSLSLKENGYKTIKIAFNGLIHEIGEKAKIITIGTHTHTIFNHSSIRRYYIARNAIYCAKKHKDISLLRILTATMFDIIIVFLFEKDKCIKLKKSLQGLFEGFYI